MPVYTDENGSPTATVRVVAPTASANPDSEQAQTSSGAAAALTATLAAVSGRRTFLAGFYVDGLGATGASIIDVTITGLLGGTITRKVNVVAGATTTITPLAVEFARPIPASADNTAIVVNVPSFGAGNTQALVGVHGFSRPA